MKKALITGVTGQDGSYLAEWLLQHGYEVHGIVRQVPDGDFPYHFHQADLSDPGSLKQVLKNVGPDEIYNLAAMSNDRQSFRMPEYTFNVDGLAALRILEAMRLYSPRAKLFQASSAELFGKVASTPQSETTAFHPRSPYGVAKMYAHWSVINYREAYQLYACNGILFNHESPRRKEAFVSRKIT